MLILHLFVLLIPIYLLKCCLFLYCHEKPVIYGVVAEIYSPDFRRPRINDFDRSQINPTTSVLEDNGIFRKETWRRLGDNNYWDDVENLVTGLRHKSEPEVEYYMNRLLEYLSI